LAARQMRHVRAHRDAVPSMFAAEIPLAAHRKAADYTVAKGRVGIAGIVLDAAVLLALTLGGVLQLLASWWASVLSPESVWHGVALIATVLVIRALIGLPLTLYRVFGIEQRFGFNKMTPGLFVVDTLKVVFLAALIGVPLLLVVLLLMKAAGPYWWL